MSRGLCSKAARNCFSKASTKSRTCRSRPGISSRKSAAGFAAAGRGKSGRGLGSVRKVGEIGLAQLFSFAGLVATADQLEEVLHEEAQDVVGELMPVAPRHGLMASDLLVGIALESQLAVGDLVVEQVVEVVAGSPTGADEMVRLQGKDRVDAGQRFLVPQGGSLPVKAGKGASDDVLPMRCALYSIRWSTAVWASLNLSGPRVGLMIRP